MDTIYFIRKDNQDCFKIGITIDIERRLAQLQTQFHEPLSVYRTITGDSEIERKLHAQFLDRRIEGEWFNISGHEIDEALSNDALYDGSRSVFRRLPVVPHKGGRIISTSIRVTPQTKEALKRLGISAADLLEEAVKAKAKEMGLLKEPP